MAGAEDSLGLEVGHGEEHLHDRVEVAAVPQVLHTSEPRAPKGSQSGPRLLDDFPLPDTLVHSYLQLRHRPLRLRGQGTEQVRGETAAGVI